MQQLVAQPQTDAAVVAAKRYDRGQNEKQRNDGR